MNLHGLDHKIDWRNPEDVKAYQKWYRENILKVRKEKFKPKINWKNPSERSEYHREYYLNVTKPKRKNAKHMSQGMSL